MGEGDNSTALPPDLILAMRAAFDRGENAMECARRHTGSNINLTAATLVAYDLQAGSYVQRVRSGPDANTRWCEQLATWLDPLMGDGHSLLEVGCGEATTLAGVLPMLGARRVQALGFDISWSRCRAGLDWLAETGTDARLFVADLFAIPLEDDAIDVVYTSHSLEPNGGREEAALAELLRVARRAVVLVEPLYEHADAAARARMASHGYVRDLQATAEKLGGRVTDCRLLPYTHNPLNPSGVVRIEKQSGASSARTANQAPRWRCPLTHAPLADQGDVFVAAAAGLAYPVMRAVPLLRSEHGVVASRLVPAPEASTPKTTAASA